MFWKPNVRTFTIQALCEGFGLEANSIEILKGQLTSLLRFTVLKNSDFNTKKLNREVN